MKNISVKISVCLIIAVTILSNIINFNLFLGYGQVSLMNMIITILFVISWIYFSFVCGRNKKRKICLRFILAFFTTQLILIMLSYFFYKIEMSFYIVPFLLPSVTLLIPLSGVIQLVDSASLGIFNGVIIVILQVLLIITLFISERKENDQ